MSAPRSAIGLRTILTVLGLSGLAYVAVVTIQLGSVLAPAAGELRGRARDLLSDHDAIAESLRRMRAARREISRHVPPFRPGEGSPLPVVSLTREVRGLLDASTVMRASVERAELPTGMRLLLADALEQETEVGLLLTEALRAIELGRPASAVEPLRASGLRSDSSSVLLSAAQREAMRHLLQGEERLLGQLERLERWALVWVIVGLVIFGVGAWLARTRLMQPVRDLELGLQRIAAGDLETAVPVRARDELGRLAAYVNEMTVVLRERAAEEARRREGLTERFGRLLDESSNEICVFDATTLRAVQANRGARENLGYSAADVERITLPGLLGAIDPTVLAEQLARLRAGDRDRLFLTTRQTRKDGSTYPVEMAVQYMRDHDAELFVTVSEDAAVRQRVRELDQRLSDVTYAQQRSLDAGDSAGAIAAIVSRAAEVLRASRVSVWRGAPEARRALSSYDNRSRRFSEGRNLEALSLPGGAATLLERVPTAGGEETLFAVEGDPARGDWSGEERAFVASLALLLGRALDATDRRNLEQALARAQRMDSIGQLAGGIAHDFNNILTAILGNLEASRATLSPGDPLDASLADAEQSARRAADLTRQLLTFARHQPVEARPVDPNATARDAERMLRRLIPSGVAMEMALDPSTSHVRVGPGQLEQVLVNLVLNARDAMPGGGTVRVTTRNVLVAAKSAKEHPTLREGPYVEVAVADTGSGIAPEVLERIFEPFFTTKAPGAGTGLGLSVCYGIVHQAGGDIGVTSAPGQGTTFRVWLPAMPAESGAVAPATRPAAPAPQSAGGGETVLVVEDERAIRELVARALGRKGYAVLQAGDGREGLAVAAGHAGPIDLLVSDVVMPHLGGPEMVRRLRETRAALPVLFISGYTADALREGHDLDGSDFLAKPFTPDELCRRVRSILDRKATPSAGVPPVAGQP